ncbi:MAG: WD40 repeat domain-containing serine/threonine protein kinase [Pirellulaceae bacterium]
MPELSESEKAIFLEALSLNDAEQRLAFVAEACGDNHQLLQSLRRLLAADEAADGKLQCASAISESFGQAASESPSEQIGRYKILEQIGEGGFGMVYMAEQQTPVVRIVALKIIKPGMDTKQVIARFESERQALALMNHPNIAIVLDAGETDSGRPYFVMELVRGLPITEYADEHCLSTHQRLKLFADVCSAIHHAHQKGIIHRDIKPTNILVTTYADDPLPKVIDFGIAKATQGRLTEKTVFTQFQQMIGTPAYMSPEQAALSTVDVDTRSDIYSLGVLLYELLTGATPLDSKQLLNSEFDELRRRIREVEPIKPSTRISKMTHDDRESLARHRNSRPEKIGRIVRGELDWIVMKAIEKDRTRRYETANSLLTDINSFLAGEPVTAAAPSTWYRCTRIAKRNRALLAVVSAVFAALAIGLCVALVFFMRERAALRLAQDNVFAADMKLAKTAMDRGNAEHALELLSKHTPDGRAPDRRGWMWRHLWSMTHQDLATVAVHPRATIQQIANSPLDNSILVAANQKGAVDASVAAVDPLSMAVTARYHLEDVGWISGLTPIVGTSLVAVESTNTGDRRVTLIDLQTGARTTHSEHAGGPPRISPRGKSIVRMRNGFRVVLRSVDSIDQLRTTGHGEIIVAKIDGTYHFRVFDTESRQFDRPESQLAGESEIRARLIRLLDNAFDSNTMPQNNESTIAKLISQLFGKKSWDTKQFRCVDVESGEVLGQSAPFFVHFWDYQPERIQMSPDGKRMAAACYGATVTIYSIPELQIVDEFNVAEQIWCLTWSSDSQSLAVGTNAGNVEVWNVRNKPEQRLAFEATPRVRPPVRHLCFSRDATRLAVSTLGQSVVVWDMRAASRDRPPDMLARYFHEITAAKLSFTPDGNRLVSGGAQDDPDNQGELKVWDTSFPTLSDLDQMKKQTVWEIALSPDGQSLAVIGDDGIVNVFDTASEQRIAVLPRHEDVIGDRIAEYPHSEMLCFSADGRLLAAANGDQTVTVFDAKTWKPRFLLDEHPSAIPETVRDIAISPDGKTIVTARGWAAVFWNAVDGGPAGAPIVDDGRVLSVEYSPDGKLLAVGRDNFTVSLVDVAERKVIWSAKTNREVEAIRFSPSGRLLACGLRDTIELYDVSELKWKHTFTGMVSNIQGLAFTPDEKSLIASCLGGIVRVYNLHVMDNVGDLIESDVGWLSSVGMSPDGNTIYVAGKNDGVTVFHAAPLLDRAEATPIGNLRNRQE